MSKRLLAHAALIGANLIYGVNYSVAKWIMPDYVNPFALVVMRAIGGVLLFWTFASFGVKEQVKRKDLYRLALCGMFGVAFNQMMFLAGLNFTTPIDASIIMTANPIVVLVAALVLLGERITWRKTLGIILGGSGAILLITSGGNVSLDSEHFVGNLLMLGNTSSYAMYLVLVKPLMKKYHPLTVIKWVFLFGSFIIIPVGFGQFSTTDFSNFTTEVWLSIGYVVIFTTFFAYLLNIVAMKWVSPTLASTYIYSQPVIASVVAIIMLQDHLTWLKVISTGLVFAGVYFVNLAGQRQMKRRLKSAGKSTVQSQN
ncbi:MAG TPA: DMT family transporter [Salinivirga sp.]|uniref:DMT family transporter n=1 Tax=Salinivirga sp. TaxID=1970192 RepID=UPI002B464FB1|nr:DMT family transporter [Salinivirga sp.]HKK59186.1 DMT family transporter [Salinivirga sp.]